MEHFLWAIFGMAILTGIMGIIKIIELRPRRYGAPRPIPKCKSRKDL